MLARLFALAAFTVTFASTPAQAGDERPLSLAIMYSYGSEITSAWYADTVRTIREAVAPRPVRVTTCDPDAFLKAADRGNFDIAIASSGLTSLMISRTDGVPLLAITTDHAPDANFGNGAAVIVRSDRDDLQTLADLKGKTVAVMSQTAFAGWQVVLVEMIRQGLHPQKDFFKNVIVTGAPMARITDSVQAREADAGFVTTCLLEGLEAKGLLAPGLFKVLDEKKDRRNTCRHSSDLYPNWLLTVKPSVTSETARKITERLLALPLGEDGLRWTIPTDHRRIYELFETLNMPLKRDLSLAAVIKAYLPWIAGGLGLVALLAANSLFLAVVVRRRTRQAEAAVKEKLASDLAAKESALKLEALNKASAVGLLSGMVAHELKQPLAAIGNYAGSLKQRLERGDDIPSATLARAVSEILRSDRTAADIVDHIRAYAKTSAPAHHAADLAALTQKAVERCRGSLRTAVPVHLHLAPPSAKVDMDPLEVELVVTNLVKNAAQAASAVAAPQVDVTVTGDARAARLSVADNGPSISDEALASIGSVGLSTKASGLGLGVAIIRSLLEVHGASLTYRRRSPSGLEAVVEWPLAKEAT